MRYRLHKLVFSAPVHIRGRKRVRRACRRAARAAFGFAVFRPVYGSRGRVCSTTSSNARVPARCGCRTCCRTPPRTITCQNPACPPKDRARGGQSRRATASGSKNSTTFRCALSRSTPPPSTRTARRLTRAPRSATSPVSGNPRCVRASRSPAGNRARTMWARSPSRPIAGFT
jgi:hypothetical protein